MSYNFSLHFSNTYRFQITNKLNYRQLQWLPLFTSHVTIHCLPTPTTTFHQYTSTYPLSDLLSNYQSSMRCPRKQIADPSHQLHFMVSHPPTLHHYLLPDYLPSTTCPTATVQETTFHPAFHQNLFNSCSEGFS